MTEQSPEAGNNNVDAMAALDDRLTACETRLRRTETLLTWLLGFSIGLGVVVLLAVFLPWYD